MKLLNPDFYKHCCQTALAQNAPSCWICKTNLPYRAKVDTLRLGDHVQIMDGGAYTVATVKNIAPDKGVQVVRPYIHTADFTYTGGVLTYIGYEELWLHFDTDVVVVRESTVTEVVEHETDPGRKLRSRRFR